MTTNRLKMAPSGAGAASQVSCFTCQNREKSEWCVLSEEDLDILNGAKICNTYQPGQVIFYQGNPCLGVYCVESGAVALRKMDANGNSALVRMAHAGQTLGYRTFFEGTGYTATAEALAVARICFIDRAAVAKLLERTPALGLRFLHRMAEDLRSAEENRLQTASLPVRTRLAHLLLTLKDRYANVDDDGTMTIELPLARQDIAAILGTRPETVARTIRALEDDGVVQFDGRLAVVQDLDALLDEIEEE